MPMFGIRPFGAQRGVPHTMCSLLSSHPSHQSVFARTYSLLPISLGINSCLSLTVAHVAGRVHSRAAHVPQHPVGVFGHEPSLRSGKGVLVFARVLATQNLVGRRMDKASERVLTLGTKAESARRAEERGRDGSGIQMRTGVAALNAAN